MRPRRESPLSLEESSLVSCWVKGSRTSVITDWMDSVVGFSFLIGEIGAGCGYWLLAFLVCEESE